MKNQQPKVEEGFILSVESIDDKYWLTFSPEKKSEGYPPSKIEITPEQHNELRLQIESGAVFKFFKVVKHGAIELNISADKFTPGSEYNFKTIKVSQDQWDGLRYSFMTGINDSNKITKLCYLQ